MNLQNFSNEQLNDKNGCTEILYYNCFDQASLLPGNALNRGIVYMGYLPENRSLLNISRVRTFSEMKLKENAPFTLTELWSTKTNYRFNCVCLNTLFRYVIFHMYGEKIRKFPNFLAKVTRLTPFLYDSHFYTEKQGWIWR